MNNYTILIPCYNDWDCLELLIPTIDKTLINLKENVNVLIVNDASTIKNTLSFNNLEKLNKIEVINLRKNVKAQKAVAIGLDYLRKIEFKGSIILMDADGQDDPKNILEIIKESLKNPEVTISISRLKREEDFVFKIFYQLYLFLTFIFTFKYMKFGAFSCLHYTLIDKMLSTNDINLAYAAALAKHFGKKTTIYANRKKRLLGTSKNNYLSLIHYALKTISVFRYQVVINSLIIFTILSIFYNLFISFKFFLILSILILLFNILIFLIYKISSKQKISNLKENIKDIMNLKK